MNMKMKKKLFFLAVAAVALASCSSDDTIAENSKVGNNQQKEIAFMPLAQNITRSAVSGAQTSTGGFPDQSIYVAAYQSAPSEAVKDYIGFSTITSGNNGAEFKKNYVGGNTGGSDNYWGAVTTPYYWPLAASTFNFLAVTEGPSSTGRTFGTETSEGSGVYQHFANQVVVNMADNKTAQHDLMYSYVQASVGQTGSNGALSFPVVGLEFKHALAWVNFTVKAADASAASAIQVKNITLNGAAYKGLFTVTMPNYNSSTNNLSTGLTASWDATTYNDATLTPKESKEVLATDGTISINTETATTVENNSEVKGILVVPNPTANANSFTDITIKYTMGGSTYNYTVAPTSLVLEPGKKYIFNITFSLHEIRINPTVENWVGGTVTPDPIAL